MSGLELAAGVIAVVQVTGQAAVLTFKIKQLWSEVRDAPEEIQDLLDDIDAASLTLQSFEEQVHQSNLAGVAYGNPALDAVLKRAQGSLRALQTVVDSLDQEIQQSRGKTRRFVKASKVLLKKPLLDRLKSRLGSSLRLLVLAAQIQMNAMVTRSTSIIERLPNPPPESSLAITSAHCNTQAHETAEDVSEQGQITQFSTMSRRTRQLQGFDPRQAGKWSWTGRLSFNFSSGDESWISIQAPSWVARSTHVFITNKALGGPQLTLRRYECVWWYAMKLHDILAQDDWPSLEMRLRSTGISPYATDERGFGLLHIVCKYQSFRILKRLLDIGLEAQVDDQAAVRDMYTLHKWNWSIFHGQSDYEPNFEFSCEIQRILLPYGLDAISNNFEHLLTTLKYIPVTSLQWYLDMFMPGTQNFSPQQRVQIACSLLPSNHDNDISVVLPELRNSSAVTEEPSCIRGSYLMHHLAQHLAWLNQEESADSGRKIQRRLHWITRCAQEDPEGPYRPAWGGDLMFHSHLYNHTWLGEWYITPLVAYLWFLKIAFRRSILFHDISRLQPAFRSLLSSLQDAGVDLAALGRNERQLYLKNIETPSLGGPLSFFGPAPPNSRPHERWRLIGISFGRRVEDWVLWYVWEYEHFAMEFWNMVENPPCHLPGSWVDETEWWESDWESLQDYGALNDDTSFVWSEVEESPEGIEAG